MSKEQISKITENTFIPISLVLTFLGGVFWLTSVYKTGEANAADIGLMKADSEKFQEKILDSLTEVKTQNARMQSTLEALKEQLQQQRRK